MKNCLNYEKPLIEYLKQTRKNIALYGMGNGAEKILKVLNANGLSVKCIFASDDFVRNKVFEGYPIISYQTAVNEFSPLIILVAFGSDKSQVIQTIKHISVTKELFFPDIEVCGNDIFSVDIYENIYQQLNIVFNMLADEQSRKVFNNLLLYKISGRLHYLFEIETHYTESYYNILKPNESEVYVDCGAYNGDTIRRFIGQTGKFKHIYGLEPDDNSFKKLDKVYGERNGISLIKGASNYFDGEIHFALKKGRQSTIDANSNIIVKSVKVDTIAPDATFIKFDVEGNEYNTLLGCEEVIKLNRPKLQVAAYHRHMDLLLPLQIFKMRQDYKVYLRHMSCIPAWDTIYFFI